MSHHGAVLQENEARRKLRKLFGREGDRIGWILVAIRDDWRCHLCHRRVKPWEKGAEGPTLDHLIPTSLGGRHVYENVRLTHRRCNAQKGAREQVQGEQLLIVSAH